MSVGPQARIGLFVVAVLLVGLVGPCLCAPRATLAGAHGCCDSHAGLKPAPPDCCADCSVSLRAKESAPLRASSPGAALASALGSAEPVLHRSAAPLPLRRLVSLVVPSPPTVLRV